MPGVVTRRSCCVLATLFMCVLYSSDTWPGQVTLYWEASPSPDVTGYKVYYGWQSRRYSWTVDAGPRTDLTVTGLSEGQRYYFAVKAYGSSGGLESRFSNEVVQTIPAPVSKSSTTSGAVANRWQETFVADSVVVLPDFASAFAFTGPDRMLVTQKGGFGGSQNASVWVVDEGRLEEAPLITFPDVQTRAQMGLLGLAVDPGYSSNRLVYVFYTHEPSNTNRVIRFRDDGRRTSVRKTELLVEIPADVCGDNQGGSVAFGLDGMLYVGVGDGGCDPCVSQEASSLSGKILRFTRDGAIPDDNPFSGSPVFALGLGNPVGLAFHPTSGELFAAENGVSALPEINRIRSGRNYGSPTFSCTASVNAACSPIERPNTPSIGCYGDSLALGGIVFYSGGRSPDTFEDNLLYGDSATGTVRRMELPLDGSDVPVVDEEFLSGFDSVKDLAVSPDGFLYVLTERDIKKVGFAHRYVHADVPSVSEKTPREQ